MRKKGMTGLIVLLFVFSLFTGTALAADYSYLKASVLAVGEKVALVNDKEIELDVAPYIKGGRTLVPLRFMETALGAEVKWDGAARSATLKTKDTEIHVTIGQTTARVNGEAVTLDVPAEIKGGRTFVPLRFISENLGANVEYDNDTKTIAIINIDKTGWKNFTVADGVYLQYPADWQVLAEDKDNLKLQTPNGNIMALKKETKDLAAVVKEKKDNYSKDGWKVAEEGPIDEAAPNDGSILVATKGDEKNTIQMEIYTGTFIKEGNTVYTWELTGKLLNIDQDILLYGELFGN